jgi:hypothetical protein
MIVPNPNFPGECFFSVKWNCVRIYNHHLERKMQAPLISIRSDVRVFIFLLMICGAWSPLATGNSQSGWMSLSISLSLSAPLLHKYIAAYYLHVPLGNYIFRFD